jgi:hypothetical protein
MTPAPATTGGMTDSGAMKMDSGAMKMDSAAMKMDSGAAKKTP